MSLYCLISGAIVSVYNWWHYHLSLEKEESWYGIIQKKTAAAERIVPTLFLHGDEILCFLSATEPKPWNCQSSWVCCLDCFHF